MPEATHEPQFEVWLEFKDKRLSKAIPQWSIKSDWFRSTDSFSFTYVSDNPKTDFKDLILEPVTLSIDGKQQLLGQIERVERTSYESVVCSGRDYFSNYLESHAGLSVDITEDMTIPEMIKEVLGGHNIQKVQTIGEDDLDMVLVRTGAPANRKPNPGISQLKIKQMTPKVNDGIFEFLHRVLARFGVMMKPGDNRSTISLEAPNYDQDPRYKIISALQGGANNVIEATLTQDWSRCTSGILLSGNIPKKDGIRGKAGIFIDTIGYLDRVTRGKVNLGEKIRAGESIGAHSRFASRVSVGDFFRLFYFKDSESKTIEQLGHAASKALSERIKDTFEYVVTLQGMKDPRTGLLYANNTLASAKDEIRDVNEDVWLAGHNFQNSSSGATTRLRCFRKGLITL